MSGIQFDFPVESVAETTKRQMNQLLLLTIYITPTITAPPHYRIEANNIFTPSMCRHDFGTDGHWKPSTGTIWYATR
jgi:hypothetical protein